jgi:hypothetical protein
MSACISQLLPVCVIVFMFRLFGNLEEGWSNVTVKCGVLSAHGAGTEGGGRSQGCYGPLRMCTEYA